MLFWTAIQLWAWCKHMFTPASAVTPVNNFRPKMFFFGKQQDDFNRVCGSSKNFRRYYISIYSPVNKNMKNCAYNGSIWQAFFAIRKQDINFHADLQRTLGKQTSRTWRKNVGPCCFSHASKHLDGIAKHSIRKFAIICNITGVTIGRKFTQNTDLSFFVK